MNDMQWTLKFERYNWSKRKTEVEEKKVSAPSILEAIRRANLQGARIISAEANKR